MGVDDDREAVRSVAEAWRSAPGDGDVTIRPHDESDVGSRDDAADTCFGTVSDSCNVFSSASSALESGMLDVHLCEQVLFSASMLLFVVVGPLRNRSEVYNDVIPPRSQPNSAQSFRWTAYRSECRWWGTMQTQQRLRRTRDSSRDRDVCPIVSTAVRRARSSCMRVGSRGCV